MVPERIRAERKDVGVGVAAAGLLPVVLVVVVEAASDAEALDSEKTLSGRQVSCSYAGRKTAAHHSGVCGFPYEHLHQIVSPGSRPHTTLVSPRLRGWPEGLCRR